MGNDLLAEKNPAAELAELVANLGDPRAQTRIYELTHLRLRATLQALGWAGQEIEDVLSDTYLALFRSAKRLHTPMSIVPWMTTVAKRQLMKNATSSGWQVQVEDTSLFADMVDPSSMSSPDAAANADALLEHLRVFLSPPDFRIVELLSAGFTPSEVTAELNIRTSRLAEVRERVRQLLRETEWRHINRPGRVVAGPKLSRQSELENEILRLPVRQREVLHYSVYAGKSPKEIAVQFGITANSARVSLHQARQSLAKRLSLSSGSISGLLTQLSEVSIQPPPINGDDGSTEMIAVVFDVARLAQRPQRDRKPIRRRLQSLIDQVVPQQALATATGDSVLVFVPMEEWRPGFVAALAMRARRYLAEDNMRHSDKLHIRVLLDIGLVNIKAKAFSSALGINLLSISESNEVRQAAPPGLVEPLTVFVSDRIHTAMLRGHALPENMHFAGPLTVPNGRGSLTFWQLASGEKREAHPHSATG